MKNKIQVFLLILSLLLNVCLIIVTIILNNNISNIEEKTEKINKTLEVQNQIITNIQQDYNTLKNQIDK